MVGRQALIPLTGWVTGRATGLGSRDRGFRLGLACAVLLHSLLLVGFLRAPIRQLGERDGSPDGISVDIIDAAEMTSLSGSEAPAQSAQTAQSPSETSPSESPSAETPSTEPSAATSQPASPPKSPPAPRPSDAKSADREPPDKDALDKNWADLLALPATSSPSQGAPKQTTSQQTGASRSGTAPRNSGALAGLDLSLPKASLQPGMNFQGSSAAVNRPPDITRSGENDDFGRGVIRALRTTMPAPDGWTGRITIRFLLTPTGNIAEIKVVGSGGDPSRDQGVAFSARQASFPLPPKNATVADRSFLVTYVYR